ncbi:MAG: 5-(carboxyamino)imidazole ribonucleotide mutase [Oscillospiraceae bacterium]
MSEIKKVAVVMGSDSDFPVVRKAGEVLKEFGVPFEMRVLSAHRSPVEVAEFAKTARENGFGVIIAAAGMAAHLAGAIAGNTTLPVIAIPVKAKALEGVDALLSSVMMPPGVPVATVGIDGAANAGHLAVEILALGNEELTEKLAAFRKKQNEKNLEADRKMQETAKEI